MSLSYEEMREYIIPWGWTTVGMIDDGRDVVGWENKKENMVCPYIEDAYNITHLHIEIIGDWEKEKDNE